MCAGMTADRLGQIAENEGTHFWFTARLRIVAHAWRDIPLPPQPAILDVGCGTGTILRTLASTPTAIGVDPLRQHLSTSPEGPHFVQGSATSLPIRTGSIDLATAFDVIEHLDDIKALREVRRVIRPTGHLIVTVPAGPRLWSTRDQDAGHLRRYTRRTLNDALHNASFKVTVCTPFQGALLPLLIASRLAGRNRPAARDMEDQPPRLVNTALSRITAAEAALAERGIRPPWGSSLLAVARAA